eukprot:g14989.t1
MTFIEEMGKSKKKNKGEVLKESAGAELAPYEILEGPDDDGWVFLLDNAWGQRYWQNTETNVKRWTHPSSGSIDVPPVFQID